MYPLNNKGILEMNELDCMRAIVAQGGVAGLNGKRINELNELDCLRIMALRAPGQSFDIMSLNPELALDASLLTDADNTTLAEWDNLGTVTATFTAGGANAANIKVRTNVQNGLRVVRFPGSEARMDTAAILSQFIANNAFTIFIVGKITTNDAAPGDSWTARTILSDSGGYFGCGFYDNTPRVGVWSYSSATDTKAVTTANTAFHLWQARHEGGNLYFQQDSDTEASGTSGNTDNIAGTVRLGTNYVNSADFIGDIAALYVFDTVLSPSDRAKAAASLKAKWGTP